MKRSLFLLISITIGFSVYAYDFKVGDIYYGKSSKDPSKAYVTYSTTYTPTSTSHSDYSGDIIIPSEVTYGGKTYNVTGISQYAFAWCSKLTSVVIPNTVDYIPGYAFQYCTGLTSISIPNSVTEIGHYAFRNCTHLENITIPNLVTKIDVNVFRGCTRLKHVVLPDSLESISGEMFYNCSSLTDIIIPSSVTKIGGLAFSGCSNLMNVSIPNSVTTIESYAFQGCSSLESVHSKIEIPLTTSVTYGDPIFNKAAKQNATLYIPKGSKILYVHTLPWSEFLNIKEVGDKPTNIKFDIYELHMNVNSTMMVVAIVEPSTATQEVEWESSNSAVATVDNFGRIKAIAPGEAIITATTTDGANLSASCKVTVHSLGDIDYDGVIDVTDVTTLINMILK